MLKMTNKINYQIISSAIEFYSNRGYQYIEVPWLVDQEIDDITKPSDRNSLTVPHWGKNLVASGEQSFYQLLSDLDNGYYMCVTPCFRDEDEDSTHRPYFMKLELISIGGFTDSLIEDASDFFCTYFKDENIADIEVDGARDLGFTSETVDFIELGSYGTRVVDGVKITYGTGVAEPRMSHALSKVPIGYHTTSIQKHVAGTLDKIGEEFNEIKDAHKNGVKIMELVELSDLYGAMEMYLENNFTDISMHDIKAMSNTTRRSFKNGRR
jgi:hypothetical protein